MKEHAKKILFIANTAALLPRLQPSRSITPLAKIPLMNAKFATKNFHRRQPYEDTKVNTGTALFRQAQIQ